MSKMVSEKNEERRILAIKIKFVLWWERKIKEKVLSFSVPRKNLINVG